LTSEWSCRKTHIFLMKINVCNVKDNLLYRTVQKFVNGFQIISFKIFEIDVFTSIFFAPNYFLIICNNITTILCAGLFFYTTITLLKKIILSPRTYLSTHFHSQTETHTETSKWQPKVGKRNLKNSK